MTDVHVTAGVYALDALDLDERSAFEEHLRVCKACQNEVADHQATAAHLSVLKTAAPPPGLRTKVLTAVRAVAATTCPNNGQIRPRSTNGTRPVPHAATTPRRATPLTVEPDLVPVAPLPARKPARVWRHRRARVVNALIAALVAITVGLGGVIYGLVRQDQTQAAQATSEQQLYIAPDAVTTTTALGDGGYVTFVASRQLNRALVLGTGLPDPLQNRYQLWTATGTSPKAPSGVVRDAQIATTDSGFKVFFRGDVASADYLAVSLEPAGSAPPRPTGPLIAAGPVSG